MKYEIYVQDTLYKTITSEDGANIGLILAETQADIANNLVTGFDETKDAQIEVRQVTA